MRQRVGVRLLLLAFAVLLPLATPNDEVVTDILIIGAGISGLRAATRLKELAPELDFVIVEATDRIGGRVRSKFNFGTDGETKYTIEEGANWISGRFRRSLAMEYGVTTRLHRWRNYKTSTFLYNGGNTSPARKVGEGRVRSAENRVLRQLRCAGRRNTRLWNGWALDDIGAVASFKRCGWKETDPLEYAMKWQFIDFEYAMADPSLWSVAPTDGATDWQVTDQRGYEYIVQQYAAENDLIPMIAFDQRVKNVKYDFQMGTYRAKVLAESSSGSTTTYLARRVIMTVPAGVLNEGLITFDPPLAYSARTSNPMKMQQYTKVFYQFGTKFWNDNDHILTLKERGNDGVCMNWLNLDRPNKLPGSKILSCALPTESMEALLGRGDSLKTGQLSRAQLSALLEPLRRVYGDDGFSEPTNVYYPKWNNDVNTGFGAYSNWVPGFTPENFYEFFGAGVDNPYIRGYCRHNGCNGSPGNRDTEWILYLSGSASCLEYQELFDGGFYSGETSADYALQDLGYDLGNNWFDKCAGDL